MEEKVIRTLNVYYYGVMVLSLLALTIMYYAFSHGWFQPIDTLSGLGVAIQYIIIIDALVTIPAGLYCFNRLCRPLRSMENKEEQLARYRKYATWRIILVSNAMPLGIVAFYLMGGYRSMLWVAAIAAVAWYFTKPTLGKLEAELAPEEPNQENY